MDRWTQYLYENHSEDELKEWASRLFMFRYFRAYGGHANDGDSLDLALSYDSTEMLLDHLKILGILPTIFSEEPEQPVPGKSYPSMEFDSFPSLIPDTEWIEQPGHCKIFDKEVFVWCEKGLLTISVGPISYEVTIKQVDSAEVLESKLGDLKSYVVDPPRDTKHYVCPKYHLSIFS